MDQVGDRKEYPDSHNRGHVLALLTRHRMESREVSFLICDVSDDHFGKLDDKIF